MLNLAQSGWVITPALLITGSTDEQADSRIPVIIEPSGDQAILIGQGKFEPVLQYLPQNYKAKAGDKVYTSGKEGIFSPGIPLGEVLVKENNFYVSLFSDLSQIVFVNVNLGNEIKNK